jgi:hypothetical protein
MAQDLINFLIGHDETLEETNIDAILESFLSMFENSDDRYFAYVVYTERMKLVISVSEDFFIEAKFGPNFKSEKSVSDFSEPLYNLSVADSRDFFIETAAPLDEVISLCKLYGFEYDFEKEKRV